MAQNRNSTLLNSSKVIIAAGLGLASNIARDSLIIAKTNQSEIIFSILYISSIASLACINSITFLKNRPSKRELQAYLIFGSLCCAAISLFAKTKLLDFFIAQIITYVWITGSYYSKILIDQKHFFTGRIRETVASNISSFLIFFGGNTRFSMVCGIFCGGLYAFLNTKKYFSKEKTDLKENKNKTPNYFLFKLAIINFPTLVMLIWAFLMNGLKQEVLSLRLGELARFSLYGYQIFVLLSLLFVEKIILWNLKNSFFVFWSLCCLGVLGLLLMQNIFGLIIVPIICALIHFYAIKIADKYQSEV